MDFLAAFLDMGSNGAFVWASFVLTVVVLGGLLMASIRSAGARQRELAALQAEKGAARASDETPA